MHHANPYYSSNQPYQPFNNLNQSIQSSYVQSNPPLHAANYNPNPLYKPFIPLVSDEDLNKQNQNDPNDQNEKLNLLHHAQEFLSDPQYQFLHFLLSCHSIDQQLESNQKQLMLDPTFSLSRLFNYFDINKDGQIQFRDFLLTLQKLDIVLKRDEMKMLFDRLGGADDTVISYPEFVQLFYPVKCKGNQFWNKAARIVNVSEEYIISEEQQMRIHDVFNLYMSIERTLVFARQQIGEEETLFELFSELDEHKKGFLVFEDIYGFVGSVTKNYERLDFKRVFNRMQRHNSGRVNFEEFVLEFGNDETRLKMQLEEQAVEIQHRHSKKNSFMEEREHTGHSWMGANSDAKQNLKKVVHINAMLNDLKRTKKDDEDDIPPLPGFTRFVFN